MASAGVMLFLTLRATRDVETLRFPTPRPMIFNRCPEAASSSAHAWTYAHSPTPGQPAMARRHDSANAAAAYAMDSVAEPLPACQQEGARGGFGWSSVAAMRLHALCAAPAVLYLRHLSCEKCRVSNERVHLRLDDLGAGVLDTLRERLNPLLRQLQSRLRLQRHSRKNVMRSDKGKKRHKVNERSTADGHEGPQEELWRPLGSVATTTKGHASATFV